MKNLIVLSILAVSTCTMTGCMTEKTCIIPNGKTVEPVPGFSEDDIRTIVSEVIQDINVKSARYSTPEKPVRVVNVKKVKIDTNSRGNDAGYLADTIAQCFKEELTNGGKFYVYNEEAARKAAAAGRPVPYEPQFVLVSTLRQRNVRRDNGNFYQEFSLNIQLIDVATSMEFWQKRVPLRKAVDEDNVMN